MLKNFSKKESEIDRLIQSGRIQEAISNLETLLLDVEDPFDVADISRKLSWEYIKTKDKAGESKAFNYAALAGENYVKAGRPAPAIACLLWIRNFPQAFSAYEKLERVIVQAFSRATGKRKSDDHLPVPTPYQEMEASISLEDFGSSDLDRSQLRQTVQKSYPLLSALKAGEVARLLRFADLLILPDEGLLFSEGDRPQGFYILAQGRLSLQSSSGLEKFVEEGDFLGDISLFGQMNHSATARAFGSCQLIYFPEVKLRECFQSIPRLGQEVLDLFYKQLFLNVAPHSLIFNILKPHELERCWDYFVPVHVPAGRIIMEPNAACDRFFLILKGKIEVRKFNQSNVFLGPGHFVGERGLILQTMRTATLATVSDCQLLECDHWSFDELCESFPEIPRGLQARRKHLEQIVFSSKNYVVD